MNRMILARGLAAAVLPARADPVADFYKGKTVQFVIRSTAGTGYDQYGRLLARHMGRHIPGNPTIIVENAPGAGSSHAIAVMDAQAKDGTARYLTSRRILVP